MTNQNAAAPANPLSDEYVNAVIQRHGYQSLETVIARLNQWIALHGDEDSVTLLMYEAHKALTKLHAPLADERAALSQYDYQALFDAIGKAVKVHPNLAIEISVQAFRAALASAPVAGEAVAMRRDERLREAAANFLNAYRVRYGGVYGQIKKHAPLQDQVLALVFASREAPPADDAAPQASEAVRDVERLEFLITHGAWVAWSKDHELCRVFHRDDDGDIEPFLGWRESARAAAYTARDAIDAAMAALSAQPGAQKEQSDAN